jgi:UDP-N-acetylmuramate dehydrogenase
LNKALPITDIDGLTLLYEEPMARHTTFQVGGPAEVLAIPADKNSLVKLVRRLAELGVKPLVIGAGSNLLVRDGGIRGVVIKTGPGLGATHWNGDGVNVGAGALLANLSAQGVERGLGGLEYACGIPGSIGGALYMNAGAYGWSFASVVAEVELVNYRGQVKLAPAPSLKFSYRHSELSGKGIALSCRLALLPSDSKLLSRLVKEVLAVRGAKLPLDLPSAGSFFKNPSPEVPAGRLLEEAGCKGMRVGGAMVSEKHANFIVNIGQAKAKDILSLMEMAKERVHRSFGIELQPEVCIVGGEEKGDG